MNLAGLKDALFKFGAEYGPIIGAKGKQIATEQLPNAGKAGAVWAQQNPIGAIGGALLVAGGATIAAPAAVALPALSAFGFTAGGVAAGSAAAAAQATIPNVIAGSVFAVCQSAAAAGAGLGVVTTATQIGGAVVAGAGGVLAWFKQ